jgi:8-oxo-dGTP pyrophosphatase MutT (NUDIX family)
MGSPTCSCTNGIRRRLWARTNSTADHVRLHLDSRSHTLTITTDSLAGPGGGANPGETPERAIVRETKEEYGLEVEIVSVQGMKVLAKTEDCLSDGSLWCCHWYLLRLDGMEQVPQVCQSLAARSALSLPPHSTDTLCGGSETLR